MRRDGYTCQIAKRYGKKEPAALVHHIFPREEFPEYQLEAWNLIAVSYAAHERLHIRDTGELTEEGKALLRRTALKYGKEIPERYR